LTTSCLAPWLRAVDTLVGPVADRIDREQRIPEPLVEALAERGLFGIGLPTRYGGRGFSPLDYGRLHAALGARSASVQGLVNVHHMAAAAVARWGNASQRARWVPELAAGRLRAALAITEPCVGSDASGVQCVAKPDGDVFVVSGTKKWITCGQSADVFLLLAHVEGSPVALIVERDTPGLSIHPIRELLGCRGYMLAELQLDECRVSAGQRVAGIGFGVSHVAATALDIGRFALAWCCYGMIQACLDLSLSHCDSRIQFGVPIREHPLVQRLLSRMITDCEATRTLCESAADARAQRARSALRQTAVAKYFASTACVRAASDAVQLHGALGCSGERPVERIFRDSKIMEVIEGTTQIQELTIARLEYQLRAV